MCAKFARVPDVDKWERSTYDFLESVAQQIETMHGRLVPFVVIGEDKFQMNYAKIKETILRGAHHR